MSFLCCGRSSMRRQSRDRHVFDDDLVNLLTAYTKGTRMDELSTRRGRRRWHSTAPPHPAGPAEVCGAHTRPQSSRPKLASQAQLVKELQAQLIKWRSSKKGVWLPRRPQCVTSSESAGINAACSGSARRRRSCTHAWSGCRSSAWRWPDFRSLGSPCGMRHAV